MAKTESVRPQSVLDPISLEVLRGRFDVLADEMQLTLLRSAYSPIIREALDATAALFDRQGRTVAQANAAPAQLGMLVASMRRVADRFPSEVAQPGDVYIINDPYSGGTHLPDITIATPIFHDGQLIGYSANMAHHQDVGGSAPGSVAPNAFDLHAEGFRIPLMKLSDRGVRNETLIELIRQNVRLPASFEGDLRAQLAACSIGARRLEEICLEWGADVILPAVDALMDYSERLTRLEIERMPDGDYTFADWLDDDGISPEPIKIQVTIKIRGSNLHFDFSGSDPQTRAAMNLVPASTMSAVYYWVRALAGPSIPNNDGCYRSISAYLPPRSIVNADYPAPVGARAITLIRLADVLNGAFAQAIPERVPAASSGQGNVMYVGGTDPATGKRFVGFIGTPIGGGLGARPNKDGIDVIENHVVNLTQYPTEACESDLPVRITSVRLWEDSGGAGQFRGGLGYVAEVEWLRSEALVSIRRDRHKFVPWGLLGGGGSLPCRTVLERADGSRQELASKTLFQIRLGDKLHIWTTGSGGYGSPLERDPQSVLADVLDRRVSREAASGVYGVVFDGDAVAEQDTVERRHALRTESDVHTSGS